ncbi:DUF222 domain-containing protein [Microbacterium sp. A82]|uniref:HNH endonuclease signature motif containing protein n=1 Tax=Microbacterium sp. A82 TaxID=3450452 RepID=UPI003F384E8D
MAVFSDVLDLIPALRGQCAGVACTLPIELNAMDDAAIVATLTEATELVNQLEQIRLAASGVVAVRSSRGTGHSGLAQSRGHRSASALIQDITGSTRAEAHRMARVGQTLLSDGQADAKGWATGTGTGPGEPGSSSWLGGPGEAPNYGNGDAAAPGNDAGTGSGSSTGAGARDGGDDPTISWGTDDGSSGSEDAPSSDGASQPTPPPPNWHAPLSRALLNGAITGAQHDVIRRGLGEPPTIDRATLNSPEDAARLEETWREAWQLATEQLITEAADRTVEELGSTARMIRDQLDPEGAAARFEERYARRSFRLWTDADGVHHGSFIFDDEAAALVRTIHDAALRPRRGGPRFIDSDERAAAKDLADDPRTNDQLAHDLMIDVLRAGALADAKTVFGVRQAGLRLVQTLNSDGTHGPAHTEDGVTPIPAAFAAQHACNIGFIPISVDSDGNPLDVGREQRLFTTKQRIALAIRDGGCRWKGCDRPASYGEAHHIDHWSTGGRTDIDRGILLCRFHHLQLHNGGWSITRDPDGHFVLHDPSGGSRILHRRLALRYAFNDIDPPPRRFRRVA